MLMCGGGGGEGGQGSACAQKQPLRQFWVFMGYVLLAPCRCTVKWQGCGSLTAELEQGR